MSHVKSESPTCCLSTSSSSSSSPVATNELKLYQAFIFSVPIFFTFILVFLFYLFYLRRRRVDWDSLRMRTSLQDNNDISDAELGLKKELREMLPIIVYRESFSVRDTQCPVCLGDYQAEDRLQQIPACRHTFHMDCIDHWLANHTTCPLCRLSLLASAKVPREASTDQVETIQGPSVTGDGVETCVQPWAEASEGSQATQFPQSMTEDSRSIQTDADQDKRRFECAGRGRETSNARNETEEPENNREFSASSHE